MSVPARLVAWIAAAALCASWPIVRATAAGVSIDAKTKTGSAAADTVVVFDPLDAAPPASPPGKAVIDQVDKRFVPNITVVRRGTAVTFPNSDHIRHQVYSFSDPKKFSLKLYAGSPQVDVTFDKPGLVVLGCNIHDTMSAFLAVVDTPYFITVPASGMANLDLPPGRYRMRLWNPKLAAPVAPREITIAGAGQSLPLTVDLKSDAGAVAAWPD